MTATDAFNANVMTCQEMQQGVFDSLPAGALKNLTVSEEYAEAIKKHANGNYQLKDLVFKDGSAGRSYDDGKKGVDFGVEKRGMIGKPIKVTEHTSYAGFNALAGRAATDSSPLPTSATNAMGMLWVKPGCIPTVTLHLVKRIEASVQKPHTPRSSMQPIPSYWILQGALVLASLPRISKAHQHQALR